MKPVYTTLLMFITFCSLFAQSPFKASILDSNGLPIDYATITFARSNTHTHTDEKGDFNLESVFLGDSIAISHLSYELFWFIIDETAMNETKIIRLKERAINLQQVVINPNKDAQKKISALDLSMNPVNNSQELLRMIPGLIIGQHAGGGKAEQIFLRGFDVDHGTDVNISIDGLPVNMVSHAHGQGYADMHFIMPEIIDQISYGKGPYEASKGNMATAGYVTLNTKDRPENSFVTSELGMFGTQRNAILLNLLSNSKESAYIASEYLTTDGPFESKQAFNRFNTFAKYTKSFENQDKISVWASHFTSRWNASGQVPERAIASGLITRFGAIDDTEGGQTKRTNLVLNSVKSLSPNLFLKSRAFLSSYDFELFSNFTFFLEDQENGDQIRQKESRILYGFESILSYQPEFLGLNPDVKGGIGFRHDDVNDVELSHTLNRKTTLEQLALGQVNETNTYAFVDATFNLSKWMFNVGGRIDAFKFIYENDLSPTYQLQSQDKLIFTPKLNVHYTINNKSQVFAKFGRGFHSNDTRVIANGQVDHILPAANGIDLGMVYKPIPSLMINTALWYLELEQEFVYVGDGGIVEPGGRTARKGIDFGIRYQPKNNFFVYADLNIAEPRSIDDAEGMNFIPLAPALTCTGGITYKFLKRFNTGIKFRHIADRPANEDNSIIASGYTVLDFNTSFQTKHFTIGFDINNVLNTAWKETQFATESRLRNEAQSVEEIHFTPGTPFFIKGKIGYLF